MACPLPSPSGYPGLQSRDFTEFVRSLKSLSSMTISMNTQPRSYNQT